MPIRNQVDSYPSPQAAPKKPTPGSSTSSEKSEPTITHQVSHLKSTYEKGASHGRVVDPEDVYISPGSSGVHFLGHSQQQTIDQKGTVPSTLCAASGMGVYRRTEAFMWH